jgi:hypothetical protein
VYSARCGVFCILFFIRKKKMVLRKLVFITANQHHLLSV